MPQPRLESDPPLVHEWDLGGHLGDHNHVKHPLPRKGEEHICTRAAATLQRVGFWGDIDPVVAAHRIKHSDARVRARAAFTLGGIGQESSPHAKHIAALLADDDAAVQRAAAHALTQIGDAGPEATASQLSNRSKEVRVRAAGALSLAGNAAVPQVDSLVDRLGDPDASAWEATAKVLVQLGRPGAAALASRLPSSDAGAWKRAIEALAKMPVPGAAVIERYLEDVDATNQLRAVHTLERLGAPGAAALERHLKHESEGARIRSLQALARMGNIASPHASSMVAMLVDRHVAVRKAATNALIEMDDLGAAAAAEGLQHEDARIRASAAKLLGQMGLAADPHASALAARLEDPDTDTWRNSAEALAEMGRVGAEALAQKFESAGPAKACARMRAEEALRWMGVIGAAMLARRVLAADEMVGVHAARALGRMGHVAEPHAAMLARGLSEGETNTLRRVCAEALGRIGDKGKEALSSRLHDPHPDVKALAAETLERLEKISKASKQSK